MYEKIMVPLDGSRFAEAALPPAVSLARQTGAEVRLVTVQEPIPGFAYEGWEPAAREHGERYLEEIRERISHQMIEKVTASFLKGHITEVLEKQAEADDVDLVVMASHGRGMMSRLWLGSVADSFVRHTDRPVLVIRPEPEPPDEPGAETETAFRKILIPLDGTELSEDALEHAVELGALYGASYSLLRVVPYPMELTSPYLPHTIQMNRSLVDDAKAAAEQYLEGRAGELRKRGYEVETTVAVAAQPARAILDEAEDGGCDLIAMSTHGRGELGRLILGSTADKVLRGTHVPVLLHRP